MRLEEESTNGSPQPWHIFEKVVEGDNFPSTLLILINIFESCPKYPKMYETSNLEKTAQYEGWITQKASVGKLKMAANSALSPVTKWGLSCIPLSLEDFVAAQPLEYGRSDL